MPNVKALALALAGLAATASYAPASADSGAEIEIRSLNGTTAEDLALKHHDVSCVEPYCIHNADGSLNPQRSYDAYIKAHQN